MSEAKSNVAMPQAEIPSAYDIPLEDIMPINARLWSEHKWIEYFERLRAEDRLGHLLPVKNHNHPCK